MRSKKGTIFLLIHFYAFPVRGPWRSGGFTLLRTIKVEGTGANDSNGRKQDVNADRISFEPAPTILFCLSCVMEALTHRYSASMAREDILASAKTMRLAFNFLLFRVPSVQRCPFRELEHFRGRNKRRKRDFLFSRDIRDIPQCKTRGSQFNRQATINYRNGTGRV